MAKAAWGRLSVLSDMNVHDSLTSSVQLELSLKPHSNRTLTS